MSIVPLYLQVNNFLCCYKTIQKLGENNLPEMFNKNTFKSLFYNEEYWGIYVVILIMQWIDIYAPDRNINLPSLSQISFIEDAPFE